MTLGNTKEISQSLRMSAKMRLMTYYYSNGLLIRFKRPMSAGYKSFTVMS